MQPRYEKELTIREASIVPGEGIKATIPSSEFPCPKDLEKIIEVNVFFRDLGYKPCVSLLGIPKLEVVIASVQIRMGLSPWAYHVVHMQQIRGIERKIFPLHQRVHRKHNSDEIDRDLR